MIPALPEPESPWIRNTDWEHIASKMHRVWIGHGWLVEADSERGVGLTFVPPANRGPWASPASAIEQLGDIAPPSVSSARPMTEEEMAQVKAGRVLPSSPHDRGWSDGIAGVPPRDTDAQYVNAYRSARRLASPGPGQ